MSYSHCRTSAKNYNTQQTAFQHAWSPCVANLTQMELPPRAVKNGAPHSIIVCVPQHRGRLPPRMAENGGAEGGCGRKSPPPAVGVRSGNITLGKFWNLRCKFLLSGPLSAWKLTHMKVQNTTYSIPGCITCTQHGVTRKWNKWRPGQDYDGTQDTGARKWDVLAKRWQP